jgi:hypothetical protein
MGNGSLSMDRGDGDLKHAKRIPFHFVGLAVPAICGVSHDINAGDFLLKSPMR